MYLLIKPFYTDSIVVVVLGFILGAILGSFVKALADRSLVNKSFTGRSQCPRCKHILRWYDLLPVISYLALGGKCRYCHKKIPREYLLVEVVMGILVGFLFWKAFSDLRFTIYDLRFNFQFSIFLLDLIFKTFFITVLAIVTLTDLKKMFIPDKVVIPSIVITLIYLIVLTLYKVGYLYYYLNQTAFGRLLLPPRSDFFQRHALAAAEPLFGSLAMGLLAGAFFMSLIIITRGKGMGGGDVKLGALIGLGLGFPGGLVGLIAAFLSGASISLILIFWGKKHFGQVVPFGPFLVLGALLALFWGSEIMNWYLHLSI